MQAIFNLDIGYLGLCALSVIGAEAETWDYPDGRLLPTLDVRERIIAEIRKCRSAGG